MSEVACLVKFVMKCGKIYLTSAFRAWNMLSRFEFYGNFTFLYASQTNLANFDA